MQELARAAQPEEQVDRWAATQANRDRLAQFRRETLAVDKHAMHLHGVLHPGLAAMVGFLFPRHRLHSPSAAPNAP